MNLRATLLICALSSSLTLVAQKPVKDSLLIDTSFMDYDLLFSELDAFLDSITAPRTFAIFNAGISQGFFNEPVGEFSVEARRNFIISPTFAYFHRSGLGITAEATLMANQNELRPYQYAGTVSYDYLSNRKISTGVSYTHFATESGLPFYTSPLQSQLFAYFTYKRAWIKPSVAVSYGWGSRSDYKDREDKIIAIQLAQRGFTRINTKETISDFNVVSSLRHDFYWLNVFGKKDFFRITPQVTFTSGTQQFGFNQTSNSYATVARTGVRVLYNSESVTLDNNLYFQPISLTGFLKSEYSAGKFFVQPQIMFDYYFPAKQNNFLVNWAVNTGVIF